MELSYKAKIIKALAEAMAKVQTMEKTNTGALLSNAFLWDEVVAYAKKESDIAWKVLQVAKVYDEEDAGGSAGTFVLAKSPHFCLQVKLSEPVKRFNEDALAEALKKKYKVPLPVTKQLCQEAKKPTKPSKSFSIVEVVPNDK